MQTGSPRPATITTGTVTSDGQSAAALSMTSLPSVSEYDTQLCSTPSRAICEGRSGRPGVGGIRVEGRSERDHSAYAFPAGCREPQSDDGACRVRHHDSGLLDVCGIEARFDRRYMLIRPVADRRSRRSAESEKVGNNETMPVTEPIVSRSPVHAGRPKPVEEHDRGPLPEHPGRERRQHRPGTRRAPFDPGSSPTRETPLGHCGDQAADGDSHQSSRMLHQLGRMERIHMPCAHLHASSTTRLDPTTCGGSTFVQPQRW